MSQLWEILVPTVRNNGRPFRKRYHKVWDRKVREISGGLTIMAPVKGEWVFGGSLKAERMIPVRFLVSDRTKVVEIIEMTQKYYDQIAILAYRISNDVILTEK